MKAQAEFFIALEGDSWHVLSILDDQVQSRQVPLDSWPPDIAALTAALDEMGYRGKGVCLGLPSEMVLAAPIDIVKLPRKTRQTAMLFLLEEHLPLEAERLTAQFLPAVGGRALGLALETQRIKPLLDLMIQSGLRVDYICPTALLAVEGLCRTHQPQENYALLAFPSRVDLFGLGAGMPIGWYSSPADGPQIARRLHADLLCFPPASPSAAIRTIGKVDGELHAALSKATDLTIQQGDEPSAMVAAAMHARNVLQGKCESWVNFRTGALAAPHPWKQLGKPLRIAAAMALALVIVLIGVFVARGVRGSMLAGEYDQRQSLAYAKLYPNTQVPTNVKSRLRSELSRLAGTTGAGQLPDRVNAMESIQRVMTAVPTALRLRLTELRASPTEILILGQVRNHSDAESFSQAMRQAGLVVQPARTETLASGGVSFTLTAKPAPATPQSQPVRGGQR